MSDDMDNDKHSATAQRWRLPQIQQVDSRSAAEFVQTTFERSSSGEDFVRQREQARREGFEQGYQDGLEQARAESQAQQAELLATLDFLRNPLARIDAQIEQQLVELALAVARQILRREIRTDPKHIIGLIRHALEQLPAGEHEIHIRLSPDAADTVEKTLQKYDSERAWHLIRDPALGPGDCQIIAEPSYIDAGVSALIDRLAVDMLGGSRQDDPVPSPATTAEDSAANAR